MPPPPVPCRRCRCPECSPPPGVYALRLAANLAGLAAVLALAVTIAVRTGWLGRLLRHLILS